MIQIQEPKYQWEIVQMNWVTALPPGGDRSYNAYLVSVDRYRKAPMLLPFHKDDTAIDTELMIWNRVISHTGVLQNIISDRDAKFTSALWTNLHNFSGTKSSFSKAYHPQTDGLAERMIQNSEEMIRRFCAYGQNSKTLMALPMIGLLLYQLLDWHKRHKYILQLEKHQRCSKKAVIQDFLMKLSKRTQLIYIQQKEVSK
ncbi:hypothetical protein O181_048248 [Austropuccinia psidii MF-1]|uniref:Integrase catalytic domain-containing protein n=1 Tax=Austropuccinia psidii MF-1 TaxID=1389203 RepID=A0A9Q3DVG2_9BASI|nr:hypothetical protein [Austropuccinia psidii MF-1]